MYSANPDQSRLRQGDVIRGVYFPRYSLKSLSLLHKIEPGGNLKFAEEAIVRAQEGLAVVLSHCCEFNEGKRNFFSLGSLNVWWKVVKAPQVTQWGLNLAALVKTSRSSFRGPTGNHEDTLKALRAANDPNVGGFNNTYLYDADGTVLAEEHNVDFTQVLSVKINDKETILASKVLELLPAKRREFQLKLGLYYSRKAE